MLRATESTNPRTLLPRDLIPFQTVPQRRENPAERQTLQPSKAVSCELFLLTEHLSLLLSTLSKIVAELGLEQQESCAQTKRERSNPPLHELRYQRKMRHWTQADLADALYQVCSPEEVERGRRVVNANMVGAWERGEHLPSLFWQKKLCLLFDATPQHL